MDALVPSPDTQALLMLFSSLERPESSELGLLTHQQLTELLEGLRARGLRPGELLDPARGASEVLPAERAADITRLLSRGVELGFALEKWAGAGLWVLSPYDAEYPARYKERLRGGAPPLLYGIGPTAFLSSGGLAIVGSRRADEEALAFTRRVARRSADRQAQVITGGARGIDSAALEGALQAGGNAVLVLADSLLRSAVNGLYRESLQEGQLTLVSPYVPTVGFAVGRAMGRNKLIYGLADWSLVVSSELRRGGTWAGATENLRRGWTPLFVRAGDDVPEGNRELLARGGVPMAAEVAAETADIVAWFREAAASAPAIEAVREKPTNHSAQSPLPL